MARDEKQRQVVQAVINVSLERSSGTFVPPKARLIKRSDIENVLLAPLHAPLGIFWPDKTKRLGELDEEALTGILGLFNAY
jgi:hypothetical protein